ncbi:uncharacterized protein C19orf47 homolog isoform X2 [Lytechinus variegatus]|uniref:uncharacterized protein C19orf47 homolog isoform X2 n=1 Tax=Lytechinus variegatus TaxID=7654 RepID=UPI001BB141FA|nr:uncharacterized protein C19orf47 homolog isoform X2 [Lytechinus variegatus]
MAANMEMSEWIKFFTAAGIPAGPAAKYSVVFLDNRIQKSMLMDLTKEYLKEMGISIMGDVIAILKYAKTAHMKYENEKPAITALSINPDAKVEVKRQTTAGNRMLEHYMRKEGIMEGGTSKVTVSPSMAVRLGAVPVGGTKKASSGILADTAEVIPVKRPRMVKPEEEGKYLISLPKGTTPKTMKIMEQKQQQQKTSGEDQKSSVFARLGSGSSPAPQPKNVEVSPAKTPGGSSVFNRLGGQRKRSVSESEPVEYQGVLKSLSSPSLATTPSTTTIKITKPTPVAKPASVKVTLGSSKLVSAMPEASLQTRLGKKSVVATRVTTPPAGAKNVMARLGAPTGKPKVVETPTPSTKPKVTVTLGGKKVATKRSAMDRLGVQKPEISTTTHMDSFGVKSKVQDRLGGADTVTRTMAKGTVKLASAKPVVKKSMQARLGAPTDASRVSSVRREPVVKQSVTVTLGGKPTAMQKRLGKTVLGASKSVASPVSSSSKVMKRLGAPVGSQKKSAMKDRLGLMKAEASSTTPSITVTMGGLGSMKNKTASAMSKNVFSRLGKS